MLNRRDFMTALGAATIARAARAFQINDDDSIRDTLRRRIEREKRTLGMAVCVVTPDRQRIVTWGRERLGDSRPVSPETVFEIASITKVFTALLLADMALHGEVRLDDPVARHLPDDFYVPELNGRPITLTDLATHTSGLPWWPPFPGEPRAFDIVFMMAAVPRFTLETFKAWLADYRLQSPPGSRLAEGHSATLEPEPPMELGIFAAGGGLRSTPRDLARFAAAILPGSGARIAPAAQLLLTVRRPAPPIDGMQALGWEVRNAPGGAFVSKDGVSWSQGASMVFDPGKRVAIVAFSNTVPNLRFAKYSGGGVGAADVAQHILRPQIPLGGQDGTSY